MSFITRTQFLTRYQMDVELHSRMLTVCLSSTANTQLLKYPLVDGVRATSHVAFDLQGRKGSAKYSSQFEVGSVSYTISKISIRFGPIQHLIMAKRHITAMTSLRPLKRPHTR